MESACRKASKDRARAHAAADRIVDQADRNIQATVERARALEAKIAKNIITALKLRYVPGVGLQSEPFDIGKGLVTSEISLTSNDSYELSPKAFEVGAAKIEFLDLQVMQWATVAVVRVSHSDPSYRIKIPWVKKQDRSKSAICIVDEDNGHYYYPVSTDIDGEVMPGVPMAGLIAFEPFRATTRKICIRIAGARFTQEDFRPEMLFRLESDALFADIAENLESPRLSEEIEAHLTREAAELRAKVEKSKGGCLVMAFATFGGIGLLSAAVRLLG